MSFRKFSVEELAVVSDALHAADAPQKLVDAVDRALRFTSTGLQVLSSTHVTSERELAVVASSGLLGRVRNQVLYRLGYEAVATAADVREGWEVSLTGEARAALAFTQPSPQLSGPTVERTHRITARLGVWKIGDWS